MSDSDNKSTDSSKIKKTTEKTETKASERRKLLKAGGVVASSALIPEKWQKPVVDTVLLPAHAQTSAPLVGTVLITGSLTPTRPSASMMAQTDSGILDTFIKPAAAQVCTPSPTSFCTPSPTSFGSPAPSAIICTPSPTQLCTPSPAAPTPAPTGAVCSATGQCIGVTPPNASNQVQVSITNVGIGLMAMTGLLTYQGVLAGITITGVFTDQSFSNTQGTLNGSGCTGSFTAALGGTCIPAAS